MTKRLSIYGKTGELDATVAERYLRGGIKSILNRSRGADPYWTERRVLHTLFPAPVIHHLHLLQPFPLTDKYADRVAAYQVKQVCAMLAERLDLDVSAPGVQLFNIHQISARYTHGLLENLASCLSERYPENGLEPFLDLAHNRFHCLSDSGLKKVELPDTELVEIYNRQANLTGKSKRILNLNNEHIKQAPPRFKRPPVGKAAVVLGCLPLVDVYDFAVASCMIRLIQGTTESARTGDGKISESPHTAYQAVLDILAKKERQLSAEEYWHPYKGFMSSHAVSAAAVPAAPLPPGEYRELLAVRQALRNDRLRLLAPYTGLHRKNATERDDLASPYPLFFLLAEEIIRQAGTGIVSLVSPAGYLSGNATAKMRKTLSTYFKTITITEMQVKRTDGIAMAELPEEKAADCAISTMIAERRRKQEHVTAEVWHMANPDLVWNLKNLHTAVGYQAIIPTEKNSYSFRPPVMTAEYLSWPSMNDIFPVRINGAMEKRGGALFDTDKDALAKRMQAYFDPSLSWDKYAGMNFGMVKEQSRFNPKKAREAARQKEGFAFDRIRPYLVKPFDIRWCYYTATRPIWHEPRPELAQLQRDGNQFLVVRSNQVVENEGIPFFFTNQLGDSDLLRGHAYFTPAWYENADGRRIANVSEPIRVYLDGLGLLRNAGAEGAAAMIQHHVLAVGFAPAYLHENRVELGQEWPRIPFPSFDPANEKTILEAHEAFLSSAALGQQVAELLAGNYPQHHRLGDGDSGGIARLTDERAALHETSVVDQGWGKTFRDGAVLPSHGKLSVRDFSIDERRMMETLAQKMGVHAGAAYSLIGDSTRDIYLNEEVCLRNIPAKVWDYTVGGYQVLKKWLSYRETQILGRALMLEEVDDFCQIIRQIAGLCLLGFHLNRNYAIIRDLHREECCSKSKY